MSLITKIQDGFAAVALDMSAALGNSRTALDQAELNSYVYARDTYRPHVAPERVRTAGYRTAGDGGGALYSRVSSEPAHPGKLSIRTGGAATVWYELEDAAVDVRAFGAEPNASGAGAKFAEAVDYLRAKGGGTLRVVGEYDISDVDQIVLPSKTTVAMDRAKIRQKGTGNKSAFYIGRGSSDISITGSGELIGPAESRACSPSTDYQLYPNHNCGLKIVGSHIRPVERVHVSPEVHIWGWDVSGIFAENTKDCTFWAKVGKCGVDGIRYYGDDSSNNQMAYIYDIGPGMDGVAPHLNAYGVVASRRPQRTQELTSPNDPTGAGWSTTGATVVAPQGNTDPYLQNGLAILREDSSNGRHSLEQTSGVDGTTWQFVSVIALRTSSTEFFRLELVGNSGGGYVRAHYDLVTGEVYLLGTNGAGAEVLAGSAGMEQVRPDQPGRWRCWFIARPGGTGTTTYRISMLPQRDTPLSWFPNYTGDPNRELRIGGMQAVRASSRSFMEYGEPLVVNPPSRRTKIGCRVHNVALWAGMDTHGGHYIDFSGGHATRCYLPFNLDNGETSGVAVNDAPHIGARLTNIFADAMDLTDTGAGISCVAKAVAKGTGVLIDNVYLKGYGGPDDYGDGRPTLGRGGIFLNNIDGFTIGDNVVLEDCKNTGITLDGVCPSGSVGSIHIRNLLSVAGSGRTMIRTQGSNIGAVRFAVPRREGSSDANYVLTGNAWVQGGFFPTTGRPTPANHVMTQGAWVYDTTLNKLIFWTGTGWRDATGAVV